MFSRWQKWVVVGVLSLAVGAPWTFLQSAAWVGMAVRYSHGDSLKGALVKTFSGNHPCRLCQFVAEGKKAEKRRVIQKVKTHVDFFLSASPPFLFPPDFNLQQLSLRSPLTPAPAPPPTPPPIPA
jgi:hypothetical protein